MLKQLPLRDRNISNTKINNLDRKYGQKKKRERNESNITPILADLMRSIEFKDFMCANIAQNDI